MYLLCNKRVPARESVVYENGHLSERKRTVDRNPLVCKCVDGCFYEEYLDILIGTIFA